MKYYIISGEVSGDLHGSNLMKALKCQDSRAQFRFWGGDQMLTQSENIVKHCKDLAFMGFWEVFANIGTILKNIKFCKRDIACYRPDVIVFIDYPGFNLRIAKWAKANGYKTFYYISPQIWAWKENRIHAIKRDIDAMFVILPFEKEFYEKKHHYSVHFVGHPLLDVISEREEITITQFRKENQLPDKPIIALLPGSRKQEISRMLPVMLSVADDFKNYCFVVAGVSSVEQIFYRRLMADNVFLVINKTYGLLAHSQAALVTSGTATLEVAMFKVPQVVCYRGNAISYQIAKRLIKLKYISLVNIIANKKIVNELIQSNLNKNNLKEELLSIFATHHRKKIMEGYDKLGKELGFSGVSERLVGLMLSLLKGEIEQK